MQWIVSRIKWIMLVSGVLTGTMVYGAYDPPGRSAFEYLLGALV